MHWPLEQVTGDIWERYVKLIDEGVNDGLVAPSRTFSLTYIDDLS